MIVSGLLVDLTSQQDTTWSHEEERQVHGRAHRYGQKRPFEVHQFEAHGTVDTLLLSLSATKEALMELFSAEAEASGTDSDMEELPHPPLSPRKKHSPSNPREITPLLLDEFERRKAVLCRLLQQPINTRNHTPPRINTGLVMFHSGTKVRLTCGQMPVTMLPTTTHKYLKMAQVWTRIALTAANRIKK